MSWLNIHICVHTQTITRMSCRWLLQHGRTPPRLEFCLFHCLLSLLMPISNVVITIVVVSWLSKLPSRSELLLHRTLSLPIPRGKRAKIRYFMITIRNSVYIWSIDIGKVFSICGLMTVFSTFLSPGKCNPGIRHSRWQRWCYPRLLR